MAEEQPKKPSGAPESDEKTSTWYVDVDGSLAGPFSADHIESLLKLEKIRRNQMIFSKEDNRWGRMYEFDQFDRRKNPPDSEQAKKFPQTARFWIYLEGQPQGPFKSDDIRKKIFNHEIRYSDLASTDKAGPWLPIAELGSFNRRGHHQLQTLSGWEPPKVPEDLPDFSEENAPKNEVALLDYFLDSVKSKKRQPSSDGPLEPRADRVSSGEPKRPLSPWIYTTALLAFLSLGMLSYWGKIKSQWDKPAKKTPVAKKVVAPAPQAAPAPKAAPVRAPAWQNPRVVPRGNPRDVEAARRKREEEKERREDDERRKREDEQDELEDQWARSPDSEDDDDESLNDEDLDDPFQRDGYQDLDDGNGDEFQDDFQEDDY